MTPQKPTPAPDSPLSLPAIARAPENSDRMPPQHAVDDFMDVTLQSVIGRIGSDLKVRQRGSKSPARIP
jgi:hypothetical protein